MTREKCELIVEKLIFEKAKKYDRLVGVLEKIRAEIQKALDEDKATDTENAKVQAIALMWCLEIIDKHIGDTE